jgi:hypothetical protein
VWTKDDTSEASKVTYTPQHETGVTRVVYDPNAPANKRIVCEMAYLHIANGETLEDLDASFGVI